MTWAGTGACPYGVDVRCGSRQNYDRVHVVWHYLECVDARAWIPHVDSFKRGINHRANGIQLHDAVSDLAESVDSTMGDDGNEIRASLRIIVPP